MSLAVACLLVLLFVACGRGSDSDPFTPPAGNAGAAAEGGAAGEGGAQEVPDDPTLGGPCLDDAQCDDGFDCTNDSCEEELARCRHLPSDAACDDGVYCNGIETCSLTLGCRAGPVVSCGDGITCTIDTCVEETQKCVHALRDADGDGDPTQDCSGNDCDDNDAYVSGEVAERCDNQKDDDCDGAIDEDDCVQPLYDRCSDALEIEATGSYELSLRGAALDYPVTCQSKFEDAAFREVVVAIVVPEGEPRDVSVVANVSEGEVVLAAVDRCGNASAETACVVGVALPDATRVSRLYLHALEPGAHAVYVATSLETTALVRVDFRDATRAPENETCGSAEPLEPGVTERVVLTGLVQDIETNCAEKTGELVYSFELEEASDVRLLAVALDSYGSPVVSLRDATCLELESELTCRSGSPRELYVRALPSGRYTVGLFGTGPTEVELTLDVAKATEALPGEGCEDAPEFEFGETEQVTLAERPDAVQSGCLVGASDAAFAYRIPEPSDVLFVARGAAVPSSCSSNGSCLPGDYCNPINNVCESRTNWYDEDYALLLAFSPCGADDGLACSVFPGRARTLALDVPEGEVRAVVENTAGKPVGLTAFRRPASGSVPVPLADECEDAVRIPETGGRFEGTTRNAFADYSASCDYGGQSPGGAPEQMLKLELDEPRRMVFDMQKSSYDTLLVLRDASGCPGSEIEGTCAPGYVSGRSYLDIELPAGKYWVQIDGYDGQAGRWVLDVFSSELE